MRFCETCGKALELESQVSVVNGKIQCHDCANAERAAAAPVVNRVQPVQPVVQPRPNANPAPKATAMQLNTNGWAKVIKVLAIIGTVLGVLVSFAAGIIMIVEGSRYSRLGGNSTGFVLSGIGIMIGGTIGSFIFLVVNMCFAQIASDISIIKNDLLNK